MSSGSNEQQLAHNCCTRYTMVPYEYEGQENSHNQLWGVALNLSYLFHIIHQVYFAKKEEIQCQLILVESWTHVVFFLRIQEFFSAICCIFPQPWEPRLLICVKITYFLNNWHFSAQWNLCKYITQELLPDKLSRKIHVIHNRQE